ncbi:MAG TPA: cytochrome c oxidase subunit 3 family protein [Candidatus Binatia bacterium]|jgi:cytochrome c oxidase subunit 3
MSDLTATHAHQFDDSVQQHEASWLGMWVFLGTEVMFFGGMFLGYTLYRNAYPQEFASASNHLDIWLGTINTAVLICSSFTMALAVRASQIGQNRLILIFLFLTIVLGIVFLGIKFTEYYQKFEEHLVPGWDFTFEGASASSAEIFFSFYFAMTGMHALHMIIGIGLLTTLIVKTARGRFSASYNTPVELIGLYWHFVDIVWIFLFPLLYLVGRHLG